MPSQTLSVTTPLMLLADEAVALAAVHAGVAAAYAYPGTPATEIVETLIRQRACNASWCANEKTAYENALGVSMAGKRALVAMKHVGLNVAADPFINSAVVSPRGGLVLAVADDPGMHSSQNEQDSRYYAELARVPCLEPATPQEAFDMTCEAFELSERFRIPVMVRLVTRVAHQRSIVVPEFTPNPTPIAERQRKEWVLLPSLARKQWQKRVEQEPEVAAWSEASSHNLLDLTRSQARGVITAGLARSYFFEVAGRGTMSHLHIGAYPIPRDLVRRLAAHVREILVLEEGYPFIERQLRGLLPPPIVIKGKFSRDVPPCGELNQDIVRSAVGVAGTRYPVSGNGGLSAQMPPIPDTDHPSLNPGPLPDRPPILCAGCPHLDAFKALADALREYESPLITSDIGCYTLGALPPVDIGESCVCMGASIGMAKGASEAGMWPVVAVIGDSTFLHSGVTPLMDAVAKNSDMTVLILDNDVVAMTGTQPTLFPSARVIEIVRGLGGDPAHRHLFESHPRRVGELTTLLRDEIGHHGLSVIVVHRECVEAAKHSKKVRRAS